MSNLKELTWEHHKAAERCGFVKILLSGNINPELYATYLWNQYLKYSELEEQANKYHLLNNLHGIERKEKIYSDFLELWEKKEIPVQLKSTTDFISHIRKIKNKSHIFAHVYVMHMGDLSGGQMIAKRVPGAGKMYHFHRDANELKNIIRSKTTDDMASEAKICFDFSIKQFNELEKLNIAHYSI
jgi:heme oxygenase